MGPHNQRTHQSKCQRTRQIMHPHCQVLTASPRFGAVYSWMPRCYGIALLSVMLWHRSYGRTQAGSLSGLAQCEQDSPQLHVVTMHVSHLLSTCGCDLAGLCTLWVCCSKPATCHPTVVAAGSMLPSAFRCATQSLSCLEKGHFNMITTVPPGLGLELTTAPSL